MKPITTVLMIALLATVASAQTAAWSLEPATVNTFESRVTMPDGYTAYTLMVNAEDGYYVGGLDLFSNGGGIYGEFYQAWKVESGLGGDTVTPTPLAGQFAGASESVDSHLLLTPSDILAAPAGEVPGYGQETNPAEVGVLGDKNVFGDYEAASGTGFIGLFGLLDPENDGYLQNLPLAHLLVRDGTDVTVVGQVDLYSNAMPSNTEGTESVEIVPEPMTMSLLGLGGLAVLRRRRK